MKRIISILTLSLILSGCGGGGGGQSENDLDVCSSYCDFACTRVGSCRGWSATLVVICSNSCISTIQRNGVATADSCRDGEAAVAGASCDALESALGLKVLSDESAAEVLGNQYGDEVY